jgi:hypothetical protein
MARLKVPNNQLIWLDTSLVENSPRDTVMVGGPGSRHGQDMFAFGGIYQRKERNLGQFPSQYHIIKQFFHYCPMVNIW